MTGKISTQINLTSYQPHVNHMPKRCHDDECQQLIQLHHSLCTLYTFLASSRRKFVITFDILKPMVEKELGREICIEDVAKIKAIIPDEILFTYVDEHKLHLEIDDLGETGGNDKIKQFLVFEYLHGKIRARKPSTMALEIRNLVSQRTEYFKTAFDRYRSSKDHEESWEYRLDKDKAKYIPVPMIYDDPMSLMMTETRDIGQQETGKLALFMKFLKNSSNYRNQLVSEFHIPSRSAVYGQLNPPLSDILQQAIESTGISQLYCHQATAINELNKGNHIIATTSTSSGKSLIYQLPVLSSLIENPDITAIYLFPTKALAQDQKKHLQNLISVLPFDVVVDTYDGDTEYSLRPLIRQRAQILFTNPDTLHASILRYHGSWERFLSNLRFVVVDELHYYSGIFGAHVSYIIRRLRRICERQYSISNIQFISCSATIRNPESLGCQMLGIEKDVIRVIDQDGSPYGEKHYGVWECPKLNQSDMKSHRVHPIGEASMLMLELTSRGIRTIAFCPVRKTCELLMRSVREQANKSPGYGQELANKIISYRGGYSASDRRKIEHEMFNGNLLGIIATNALELGIDIGGLDAVIIVGFPHSLSSFRQQVGRSGRRNQDSLAMLVCGEGAVDQYYVQHPRELIDGPSTEIPLTLDNQLIRDFELSCANSELTLDIEDEKYFGQLNEYQDNQGDLKMKVAAIEGYNSSLRGVQERCFAVVDVTDDQDVVIEEVEESRVTFTLYEGAIFLHKGQSYLVVDFNPDQLYAKVQKVNVDWLTRQRDFTDVDPIEAVMRRRLEVRREMEREMSTDKSSISIEMKVKSSQSTELNSGRSETPDSRSNKLESIDKQESIDLESAGVPSIDLRPTNTNVSSIDPVPPFVYYGRIKITMLVFGFFKVNSKDQIIDQVEVEPHPYTIRRSGFWINVPKSALDMLKMKNLSLAGAIHGAEHIIMSMLPTISPTVNGEIATECKAPEKEFSHRQTERVRPGRLIFYSTRVEAGSIAQTGYRFAEELLTKACNRVENCPCEWGCPDCIAYPGCKERNEVISKIGTRVIMRELIGDAMKKEDIPMGPEPNLPEIGIETVTVAVD